MSSSRIAGAAFLALSCLYGYLAGDIPLDFWSEQEPFNARSMPRIIAACGAVASLVLIFDPAPAARWPDFAHLNWRPALLLLVGMSGYGLSIEPFGFALATLGFLLFAFVVLGERRIPRMLLVAVPLVAGFWLLMNALGIYLGPGAVLEDLWQGVAGSAGS